MRYTKNIHIKTFHVSLICLSFLVCSPARVCIGIIDIGRGLAYGDGPAQTSDSAVHYIHLVYLGMDSPSWSTPVLAKILLGKILKSIRLNLLRS